MRDRSIRIAFGALLATTAMPITPALGQTTPAPKFTTVDDNGVDLVTGLPWFRFDEGAIGTGEGAIRIQRIWAESAGVVDNWSGGATVISNTATVLLDGVSDTFTKVGSTYISDKADGSRFEVQGNGKPLYTSRDGTKIEFEVAAGSTIYTCPGVPTDGQCSVPLSITRPSGSRFVLTRDTRCAWVGGIHQIA